MNNENPDPLPMRFFRRIRMEFSGGLDDCFNGGKEAPTGWALLTWIRNPFLLNSTVHSKERLGFSIHCGSNNRDDFGNDDCGK